MERVLVAVVLNVICGTGLAAADTVALLQESLRVREEAPSANDWWIFSRHRRSKEQNQEEGLLPGPIRETSMDSFGSAENLSDENEEEEEEQEEEEEEVWLARKPGTKKKGKKESAGQKGEDKKKEAKKESADQKGEDLKKKEAKKESAVQKSEDPKKEAKKESAVQKSEDPKKEAKKESAGQKGEDSKKEVKKESAGQKAEDTKKEAKKPTEAPTKKEGTEVTSDTTSAADQSFKIGDWVQVLDTSTGTWKDCKITSSGHWPKTWDLHFPRTVGNMKDVPAHFLRRPPAPSQTPTPAAQPATAKATQPAAAQATQPAAAQATQPATAQAAQPGAQVPLAPANASAAVARPNASAGEIPFGPYNPYRYKVGDTMEVQTQTNGRWVPCKIMKKGKDDDKYDLHIPMAPPGQRDIKNVPSAALRPYDSAEYEQLESMMGRSDVDYGDILGRMATSEKTYAEGERADVKVSAGEFKGQYVPCEVLGQGSSPTTYQIRVGQQEYSVPYYDLRKIAAPKSSASSDSSETEEAEQPEQPEQPETPQPAEVEQPVQPETQKPAEATSVEAPASPLPHFAPGDAAEVLVKDGPHRGTWIKVSITELGNNPDTYNIDTGSAKFSNVPASTLRAVDQSTAWDI